MHSVYTREWGFLLPTQKKEILLKLQEVFPKWTRISPRNTFHIVACVTFTEHLKPSLMPWHTPSLSWRLPSGCQWLPQMHSTVSKEWYFILNFTSKHSFFQLSYSSLILIFNPFRKWKSNTPWRFLSSTICSLTYVLILRHRHSKYKPAIQLEVWLIRNIDSVQKHITVI